MLQFEFRSFDENAENQETTFERLKTDAAAKSKAGRMAKARNGPVDLARAGGADWSERYLTTAAPDEFNATGYYFERL